MHTTHSGQILFRNTMAITGGHLEGFKQAVNQGVEFASEHGPQLMVEVFIDEHRMLAYSFQLYRDSAAILAHWSMSDPYIRDVMEHCAVQRLDVYGQPDEAVMAGLGQLSGADVTVTPHFTGFTRLAPAEQRL